MKIISQIDEARLYLNEGKIVAYPTEAVYGLGCDPFNQEAVETLLNLKHRPVSKGVILLIADWLQLPSLISNDVPEHVMATVRKTWPGHVTWVFPKSKIIPMWLSGEHETIAIRMSAHPVARELCAAGPVVSTSANMAGDEPAVTMAELYRQFPTGIDAVLAGDLGGASQPSAIYDVLKGRRLR